MNKKIIGIIIVMLLTGTALTSAGMTNKIPDGITTTNNCKDGFSKYSEYDFNCINKNGIFNPPVMTIDNEQLMVEPDHYEPELVDLPEYFSWKDYEGKDWTTPARNQGGCGSCWAFAAVAALESVINIREGMADLDPHLSVQYILSCLIKNGCNGGSPWNAFDKIFRNDSKGNYCNGIIPEALFPYQADDSISCDEKSENWMDFLVSIFNYSQFLGGDDPIDVIKSKIIQDGPICSSMNAMNENSTFMKWGYTNHNEDDYFPFEVGGFIDHCVIIVGWKDSPSIGKGGYWICKNSWGPTFGYDGFFNIEYDSLHIGMEYQAWVDYNPDDYDWHPVPKVNGPFYGLVGEPISFEGDAVGENPPFTYYWDFGDDSTSTDQNPSYTYSNPGEYTVLLTVTDDNGVSMTEETFSWIQQTNQPPSVPIIEGPVEIGKGELCWYNFTFSDPDGSDLYLYVVAFGMESNMWWGPYPPDWGKEFINHYWDEEGDYIVKAKAKDPYGAESDWATFEVTVPKTKVIDISSLLQRFFHPFPFFEKILNQII